MGQARDAPASTPIENPGVGRAATLLVDDPNCLRLANDATKAAYPRAVISYFHVLLPMSKPIRDAILHPFSRIVIRVSDGIELNMPDYLEMTGGFNKPDHAD